MFTRWMNVMVALVLLEAWTGVAAGQGVVAWYEFENDVTDSSGNGRDGTVENGPVNYVEGVVGQAIGFDNTSQRVNLGNLSLPSAMTVSLWARFESGHFVVLASQEERISGNRYGWELRIIPNGDVHDLSFRLGTGTSARDEVREIFWAVAADRWHHLAVTYDGASTGRIYVDGQLYAENTNMSYAPVANADASLRPFTGLPSGEVELLDEVLILDRAMDAGEIADLYNLVYYVPVVECEPDPLGFDCVCVEDADCTVWSEDAVCDVEAGLCQIPAQGVGVTWPLAVSPGNAQGLVALEDGPAPAPVTYTVYNDDAGAVHTMDIAEVDENGDAMDYAWLDLSTTQIVDLAASSNTTVDALIDHSVLAPGDYTAYLRFSDDSDPARALIRRIDLTVIGCQWTVSTGSVSRVALHGSGDPLAPVEYTVTNTGKDGLTYTVAKVGSCDWLTLDKSGDGPLNHEATSVVTAAIDVTGLEPGEYACDLEFINNCDPADQETYTVTLFVEEGYLSADGLLAYYRLEDNAQDWTGNGYDGTVIGTPAYDEGQLGRAIEIIPESGEGVDLGAAPCPDPAASREMSVAVWFRDTGGFRSGWLVDKLSGVGGYWRGWQIKVGHEWWGLEWQVSTLTFSYTDDGFRNSIAHDIAVPDLYDGNWHLIVMTIEDAGAGLVNVRGYYDGALLEGPNIWNSEEWVRAEVLDVPFEPADVSTPTWIANVPQGGFKGGADEVSFWDRALTPEEIEFMYLNPGRLPPPVLTSPWPDADGNGDVDQDDFAAFQRCYDPQSVAPGCERFDRDGNEAVDQNDLIEFLNCVTGPGILLDPENPPDGCEL